MGLQSMRLGARVTGVPLAVLILVGFLVDSLLIDHDGLVRISVGIEDADDLVADLQRGLDAV